MTCAWATASAWSTAASTAIDASASLVALIARPAAHQGKVLRMLTGSLLREDCSAAERVCTVQKEINRPRVSAAICRLPDAPPAWVRRGRSISGKWQKRWRQAQRASLAPVQTQ